MTKKDFVELYGHAKVSFSSYYKYMFTFSGVFDNGDKILVEIGGDSSDIYRFALCRDDVFLVSDLDIISGTIIDVKGSTPVSFWEH